MYVGGKGENVNI